MSTPINRDTRPAFFVKGAAVPALGKDLVRLEIHDSVDGMCRAEASFGNWGPNGSTVGFLHFGTDSPLDLGVALEIRLGDTAVFSGKITAIEAEFPAGTSAPCLTVLAEDRLQDLRLTRRTRAFERQTDQQIFERVCSDHGLTLDGAIEGPLHATVGQLNQSDLAFLRGRASLLGLDLWLHGARLKVQGKRAPQPEVPSLAYGAELQSFRVVADLAEHRDGLAREDTEVHLGRSDEEARVAVGAGHLDDPLRPAHELLHQVGQLGTSPTWRSSARPCASPAGTSARPRPSRAKPPSSSFAPSSATASARVRACSRSGSAPGSPPSCTPCPRTPPPPAPRLRRECVRTTSASSMTSSISARARWRPPWGAPWT